MGLGDSASGRAVANSAPLSLKHVKPGALPDSPTRCTRVTPAWPFHNCAADQKWDGNPSGSPGHLLHSCPYRGNQVRGLCAQHLINKDPFKRSLIISKSSHRGSVETNLMSIHRDTGLIPGPAQWVKDLVLV